MSVQACIVIRKEVESSKHAKAFYEQILLSIIPPEEFFNVNHPDSSKSKTSLNITEHIETKEIPS